MREPTRNHIRRRHGNAHIQCSRAAGSALALTLLAAACVLVVTACGSSSSAAPASTTTTASSSTSTANATRPTGTTAVGESFAAYQTCLKSHGVTVPTGDGFAAGAGTPTTTTPSTPVTTTPRTRQAVPAADQKALTACAGLRPSGGFAGSGGFTSTNPAFTKLETCLKSHGVQTGTAAPRTSTAYQSALTACRSLLPAGGFGGAGAGRGNAGAAGGANSATFAKYQACLKQHGVQTSAAGQTTSKLQAAITACRSVLPTSNISTTTTSG